MILCSCNVITDHNIAEYLSTIKHKPSVGSIMKHFGCDKICGSCAISMAKAIQDHINKENEHV